MGNKLKSLWMMRRRQWFKKAKPPSGGDKNDMKKQGGGTETDGFPLNTYIFNDFALFLYIYRKTDKERRID